MKINAFFKKAGFVTVLLSALIISFSSCDVEVGLGSSVDTRAPELTISNPPSGSVIRDVFYMNGTCSDDGTIESITIDLKQTSNSAFSYSHKGTFNQKEGIWTCEINPLSPTNQIPDGTYEVIVTIKDAAGRETIRTKQYTIDNTAPVIAITRPSAVIPSIVDFETFSSTDYDSYGQELVIEGHVADTCERRYISVDVFDMKGNLKYSTLDAEDSTKKRIKIDSDFSTTIANFGDEAYTAIYGDDDEAGTKTFFCEITVYDDACKYPADGTTPSGDNAVGNSTKYFYLYEGDLYSTIFDSYGMTNAYKLLNGSFEEEDSKALAVSLSREEAKSSLESEQYKETRGFWSLNPKNNPYFKVSGHEGFSKEAVESGSVFEDTENNITNNSTVVVEVYPGLDQTPLVQDNLGLYLLKVNYDEEKDKWTYDVNQKIWLVRPLVDDKGSAIIDAEEELEEIEERKKQISKIGSTYKFTVSLSTKKTLADGTTLHSSDKYIFGVQGWDKKSIPVKNADSIFGFKLVESGTAPSITVKSVTPKWITTNQNTEENPALITEDAAKTISVDLAFSGDAPFSLSRIINEAEDEPEEIIRKLDNYTDDSFIDTYTPPAGAGSGKIKYVLTGNNDLTCDEEIEFNVDNDRPEVLSLKLPDIYDTEKTSYKFKGTVSDGNSAASSKIADVRMKLSYIDDNNSSVEAECSVGNSDNWEHTVVFQEDDDFKKIFSTEGMKKIEVYAVDAAGNISEIKEDTFLYDINYPEVYVTKYKMGNNAAQTIKNEFFVSESFSLSGTVKDTYGIESVTVKQVKGDGNNAVELEIPVHPDNNGQWTIENLPRDTAEGNTEQALVETGIYKYSVTVIDKTGEKKAKSSDYTVRIDLEAPTVTITSPSSNSIEGTNFLFKGTMNDDDGTGINSYSYKFVKSDTAEDSIEWTEVITASDSWSFYKELAAGNTASENNLCEGDWSLFVKAKDVAGNESVPVKRQFTVDITYPELTEIGIGTAGSTVRNGITLSGTASDSNGIEAVVITDNLNTASSWTITRTAMTAGSTAGTYNWSQQIQLGTETNKLIDGNHTLTITATDISGKQTRITRSVIVDTTAPDILTITSPATDDATGAAAISGSSKVFTGNATDNISGLESYSYVFSQSATAPTEGWTTVEAENGNWSINRTVSSTTQAAEGCLHEGEWYLFIKAKDKAGNETQTPVTRRFWVDQSVPALTNVNLAAGTGAYFFKTAALTISGKAIDTHALAENAVVIKKAGTAVAAISRTDVASDGSWEVTLDEEIIPDDGTSVTLTIEATDVVGKSSGVSTYNVCKDMVAPTATVSPSVDAELAYQKSVNYEFTGTASDTNLDEVTAELYKNGTKVDETTLSTDRTTNIWKWKVYDLEEATYNIKVTAKDKADNSTECQSGSIRVDTIAPVTNVNGTALYEANGTTPVTEVTNGETVEAGTYYAQSSYTLSGVVTDANFEYSATSFILKENGTEKTVNFTDSGWTYTPAGFADGNYAYTITVTDKAQNKTVYSFTVVYDTTAPVVVISSPENTAYSSAPEANGTVRDAGIGIAEIKWSIDNNTWTAADWTSGSNWSVDLGTMEHEGSVTLYVKAKDKFGKETSQNVSFSYDLNNPVVSETDSVEGYQKAGYSFTLTGTAYDTNELSYVEIVDRIGNTVQGTYRVDNDDSTTNTITITNGSIATAKSAESALTWSKTFAYNDTTPLEQGQHTFTITAKDTAGKTSNTATKTVFVDTVAPQITSALIPNENDTENPSFRFRGNALDNENGSADSGIEIVKLKIKSYNTTDGTVPAANADAVNETDWIEASGTTGWIYTAVFSELSNVFNTSGYKKLFVQAIDEAGNASNIYESDYFLYDTSEPTVSLNNYKLNGETGTRSLANVASAFISDNFTLNATITDDYRIATIVVKQGETEIERITNKNGTNESISIANLPRNDENTGALSLTTSGEYTFTITATDAAGKTVTGASFTTTVDKEEPVISITIPNADLGKSAALSQVSYTFRGEASDNAGGSGIAKYRYMFNHSATEPEYTDSNWSAEQELTASWTLAQTLVEGNTAVANGLYEGEWYLWMYAVDAAGNKSDIINRHFWVDKNNPSLTSTVAENSAASNTVVAVSGIYYFDEAISGTASATDSSNTTPDISFWIGETELEAAWGTGTDSNKWTISKDTFDTLVDANTLANNTLYQLTIRAKDVVDKVTDKEYSIYRDTAVPTVTIESPVAGSNYQAQEITVRGTTGDAGGSGVISIEYSTNGTDYSALDSFTPGGQSWSTTQQLSDEGDITVYVKATDRLGRTADDDVSFYYDAAIPELRETDNVAGPGNATSFTLTGKAWDTNGLSKIEITDQTKNKVYNSDSAYISLTVATALPANNNWTATFVVGTDNSSAANYFAEGDHQIVIKAYDVAGRVSESISKNIFVDLVDPEVSIETPTQYINQTTYQFNGTVTDVNLTKVEVELFEYVDGTNDISKGSQVVATIANDTPNSYDWTYAGYGFTSGKEYYIKVTATDRGTRTTTVNTSNNKVYIDTVAPTSTLTGTGLYTTDSTGVVSATGSLINAGTVYAKSAYTLSGTVTENKSMGTVKLITDNDEDNAVTLATATQLADDSNIWTVEDLTGSHNYTIVTTDAAGNSNRYTLNVVYDIAAPSTIFSISDAITKNTAYTYKGTVTENNLYNATITIYNYINDSYVARTEEAGTDTTVNVNSDGTWSYTVTGLSEGRHKVTITLKDKANNSATTSLDNSPVITVDTISPAITYAATNVKNEAFASATALTSGNTYYCSNTDGYSVTATITDSNFDAEESTLKVDSGTATALSSVSEYSDGTWTVTDVNANHTYVFTLKDAVGNTTTSTIQIRYDVTGPTIDIKNPAADNTTNGNAALDADSYSFRINANDGTGVGIKTLKYKFINSATPVTNEAATATNGWTIDNDAIDGDKFVAMNLVPLHTVDSNNEPITNSLSAEQIPEGTWYLHAIGIDKAGNASDDVVRAFIVDKAKPATTVTANVSNDELSTDDAYYFNSTNLTLAGTITETHGLDSTAAVVITKTTGNSTSTLKTFIASEITDNSWSVSIPTAATETAENIKNDVMTLITVTVKDKAGRTTSYKYNVYKDTVAPAINITSITNGDYFSDNYRENVGGTIIDTGSGVNTATYKLERITSMTESVVNNETVYTYVTDTENPVVQTKTANAEGSGFTLAGSTATIANLSFGTEEGALLLTVTAEDEAGNSNTKKVHFSYDLFKPDFTETTVGASGKTSNAAVTFSGVGYDTNEFWKIEFTDTSISENVIRTITSASSSSEWSQEENPSTITKNGNDYSVQKVNWSQTFAVGTESGQLADGEHIFKIVAYDKAGKSTEHQRTVIVDTVKPDTPTISITGLQNIGGTNYYASRTVPIVVTTSDARSGISAVKYTRDEPSNDPDASPRNWVTLAFDSNNNGTVTYKGNVNCVEDLNTIYVKAIDIAGNESTESNIAVTVDTTAPEFELGTVDGAILSGIKLVNGRSALTFTGTVTESGSGVDSVTAKIGDNTITGTTSSTTSPYSYSIEIGTDDMPANTTPVSVIVTVEDKVGNKKDFTTFQLQKDDVYPLATVGTIIDADTSTQDIVEVNGIITVSGTASDEHSLTGIKLQYSKSTPTTTEGNTTWSDWSAWTDYTTTPNTTGSYYNWSYSIDTTAENTPFTDGAKVRFRAVATDEAGNSGNSGTTTQYSADDAANNKMVIISQDTDRPIIKINNLSMATPVEANSPYYWHRYNSMYGTVQDDDGTVEYVKYKIHKAVVLTESPTGWPTGYYTESTCTQEQAATGTFVAGTYYTKSDLSNNCYSNGMWEIPSLEDGQADIYFEVKDATGKTFTCNTASTTSTSYGPKIKDSSGAEKLGYTSANENDIIKVKVDNNYPQVLTPKYYLSSSASYDENTNWTSASNLGELTAKDSGGPVNRYLYVRIEASDSNGIDISNCSISFDNVSSTTTADTPATEESPAVINKVRRLTPITAGNSVIWIVRIDLYQFETGLQEFKLSIKDNAGKETPATVNVLVDNTAPISITNVKPSPNEVVSGVVSFRGNISDNENGVGILYETNNNGEITNYGVQYYIPTYAQTQAQGGAAVISSDSWAYPTTKGSVSWEIEFNNLGSTIGYYISGSSYGVNSNFENFERKENNIGTGIYDIPVWFRLTDALGNVGYVTSNSIRFNPNADRPTVQITYPEYENGQTSVTMGGTINISGNAIDDDGIEAVYLQFDLGGENRNDYENGLESDGDTVIEGITSLPFNKSEVVSIPHTDQKGIRVNGTKSWYKILKISGISTGTTIKVRAISIEKDEDKNNNDILISAWSDVLNIAVNNDLPNFSEKKIKKYASEPTYSTLSTAASGEIDYSSEMYIKDENDTNWYFVSKVELGEGTDATISEIDATVETITRTGSSIQTLATSTLQYTEGASTNTLIAGLADEGKTGSFAIPLQLEDEQGTGLRITVVASDTTEGNTPGREQFIIFIDKEAPEFTDTKTVSGQTEIKLFKNNYGSNGTELSTATSDNYILNSNGSFTLAGKVSEEGSGFERLVFYFERRGSGEDTANRVYNPMEAHGTNNDANRTNLTELGEDDDPESGNVFINAEKLPALYLSGLERDNNLTVTSPSLKNNKNIRKGGLIKIGGVYRLIDNIDARDTSGTITFTPGCETTYTDAEFIYGMVVNHSGESLDSNGVVKGDDGDGMVESFQKVGNDYTWDANINSQNIPDGPIEIHCVVFDAAGNFAHGYTTTKVSNNPPRITSVMLGTDLNNDTYYALDKEFKTFYAFTNNSDEGDASKGKDIWNLDAENWTAKKDLVVIPEFVGGTGTVYYNYSKSTGATAEGLTEPVTGVFNNTPATDTLKALVSSNAKIIENVSSSNTAATLSASRTGNSVGALILANGTGTAEQGNVDDLNTISTIAGENGTNVYRFTFWDSTEGCTIGTDTQWSILNATFKQDLIDDTAPTGTIKPFYWTSLTNNSVYTSKTVENISSIADLEGHIELEDDLPTENFNAGSGEYDLDPKVSGKVKMEGTAFDETLLKTIAVTFANKTATATYTSGSGWSYSGNEDGVYTLEVKDDDGPVQSGHSVTWKLIADTSSVVTNAVAATDVGITVTVRDASSVNEGNGNSSTPGTAQTTASILTGYYKVDIVPYITKVETKLSSLKTNWSVFNRTAQGHYPIASDESIKIYGFNLTDGTVNFASVDGNAATNSYAAGGVTIPENAKSGEASITFGSDESLITSLNNINDNDSKGAYSGTVNLITNPTGIKSVYDNYYNRLPNGDNNNLLTDDVVFDIWQIDPEAAKPIRGKIQQPVMKINPATEQVGFAFANGAAYFSMPGKTITGKTYDKWAGTDKVNSTDNHYQNEYFAEVNPVTSYSYTYWNAELEQFTSVGFAYDNEGYSYGVAAGGDINSGQNSTVDLFSFMTDRWGPALANSNNIHQSSKNNYNQLWLEGTGLDFGNGEKVFEQKRIISPSIVTASHSDGTCIYLAYYDVLTNEIRFRAGNIASKTNYTTYQQIKSLTESINSSGETYKYYTSGGFDVNIAIGNKVKIYLKSGKNYIEKYGPYTIANIRGNNKFSLFDDDGNEVFFEIEDGKAITDYYMLPVSNNHKGEFGTFKKSVGSTTIPANKYDNVAVIAGNISGRNAGEYVSIGVIPGSTASGDVVVAIWYGDDNTLWYSYKTNPLNDLFNNQNALNWSTAANIFSGALVNAGEYCQLAVDGNGGIHIAALDSSNNDLVYAYIENYSTPENAITCMVDSNGIVGENLTIDVAIEDGNPIPRISYYNGSSKKPKLAYLADTSFYTASSTQIIAGAVEDMYTGIWECSVIPTSSKLELSDTANRINVALWKNADGSIKTPTKLLNAKEQSVDHVNLYSVTSYGIKGGNGTKNPILGYSVKKNATTSNVETAQMK